jgi:hypothetical protein
MSAKEETSGKTYASFEDFWPDYVRAHANKTNRQLHFVGSTLAAVCVVGGVITRRPLLLLAAPVVGYGFAWVGHFVFEKNKPATFTHPLYSLRGDWVMWSKIANGTMDAEVERYTRETAEPVEAQAHAPTEVSATAVPVDVTVN